MLNVSQLFKDYNSLNSRIIENKVLINNIEFGSDSIYDINIQTTLVPGEEFTVGTVIPKKLTLKIKASSIIPTNAKIEPFVRLMGDSGASEWVPLGIYYIDNRGIVDDIYTLTCYDKLIMAETYLNSSLVYPNTMLAVFNEILNLLDITTTAVISNIRQIPYKDEEITIREMLSYIASAHGGSFILDFNNVLKLITFTSGSTITKEINTNEYFKIYQLNPQKVIQGILVTINEQGEVIHKGVNDSDNIVTFYNPFAWIDGANTGLLDEILTKINNFSYMPTRLEWKGTPELELGDKIKINLKNGTSIETIILNQTFSFKGGMKSTILSPSTSEQTSEFNFKSIINKLRRAVSGLQENEVYFGVSIGRQYGLKISKSDGSSEILLNSDEMSFKAKDSEGNMVDRIYFDTVTGNYKFTGDLSISSSSGNSEVNFNDSEIAFRAKNSQGNMIDRIYFDTAAGNYKFTGDLNITSSSGNSEVSFNDSEITFKAKDSQGNMRNSIYFDTASGKYVFDGDLSATTIEAVKAQINVVVSDTIIVNNLYAQTGRIADLTVNHLLTGDFLSGDNELFYIDIFADNLNFIQAYKTNKPKVQYTDYNGSLLYWESEAHEFMTTDVTEWPVMVDVYDSSVVYSVKVEDITDNIGTLRVPTITFGRGDRATPLSAKGRIYKNRDSLVVEYNASSTGDKRELILSDRGIIMMVNGEEAPAGFGVTNFGSKVFNPRFISQGIVRNIHYVQDLDSINIDSIPEGDIILVPRTEEIIPEGGGINR